MTPDQSTVAAQGTVTPAAPMQAGQALLRATITITRAATGAVETYELIGTPVATQEEQDKWL